MTEEKEAQIVDFALKAMSKLRIAICRAQKIG
jgi:hypothetical protein